jgi:pimeloyl-ACP methyl ester carboxylesterase
MCGGSGCWPVRSGFRRRTVCRLSVATPELARRIPGAELVVHEGPGYALILERPEESWEGIRSFLAESEALHR